VRGALMLDYSMKTDDYAMIDSPDRSEKVHKKKRQELLNINEE